MCKSESAYNSTSKKINYKTKPICYEINFYPPIFLLFKGKYANCYRLCKRYLTQIVFVLLAA